MAQDVTSDAPAAGALSNATIIQLLELAPDAIVVVGARGAIRLVNAATERLFGYPRAELLGRSVETLLPERLRGVHAAHMTGYATAPRERPMGIGLELLARRRDGGEFPVEISLSPLEAGDEPLVMAAVRDATERQRAEDELRRSAARLAEAQQIAQIGNWDWDPATGSLLWSDELYRIYGVDPATFEPTFERFLALLHPDDRERVARTVNQAEHDLRPFEYFHRIVRPDGAVRAIHARGEMIVDEHGRFVRMAGTGQDVTELRAAQERARQLDAEIAARADAEAAQRRLALLAEASAVLAASLDWETSLSGLARLIVARFADLCVVDLLYDPAIRPVVVAHRDPLIEERVREMRRLYPLEVGRNAPVAQVAAQGEAMLFREVTDEFQASIARDERHRDMLVALGYRSAIVAPMATRGQTLGSLMLVRHDAARPFDADDLVLAQELARRAATSVDNARLYAAEQAARLEAERTSDRVSRLQSVTAAFSRARTAVEVEETVVEVAASTLGATQGLVMALNAAGDALEFVGALGFDDETTRGWPRVPLDRPVPATETVRLGEPIWLETRAERLARYPALAATMTADAEASVALPLLMNGRTIGVLGLTFSAPRRFDEADREFLMALAQQCAQALERARLHEAERAAHAAAAEAVSAREVFLSIAAHELKTPLTTIKAAAHLLDRRLTPAGVEDERIHRLSRQLRGEIDRLETLVSDLLDVSRIQRGQLELRRTAVDLGALAAEVLARFDEAVERRPEHALELAVAGAVTGEWDAARLDQVLSNLLSNALKYSPDGGMIRVQVTRAGDEALLTVSDEGIGITPAEREQLFQPFVRGDAARSTVGGTGLGLYIASEIVRRHAGTIELTSEPNVGSAFTVRLPLTPPADAP